jgi:phage shock protein A
MADINLFSRLNNLLKGFISLFIADVEKNHPEIAYENAIQSLTERFIKLQRASAAIIARREDINGRVAKYSKELAAVTQQLEAALQTQQDDLAVVLLQKKNALEAALQEASGEATQAHTEAESAKSSLMSVKAEIGKLKAEKDHMLAKMQSAQARLRINQQLDGLSVDAEVQALDRVREHIKTTIAQANLSTELRESDLDVRLAKLSQDSGSITARAQLEQMKAQRAAAAAQPTKQM